MKLYKVGASSMTATYSAGKFVADSKDEAIRKARASYMSSSLGRALKDAGAFHYYITGEESIDG